MAAAGRVLAVIYTERGDGRTRIISAWKATLARMRRVPFAKHVRWKVGLSQSEFARRFQIPIGTLGDWEQWRSEPDQAALAYLKVIAADARSVERALAAA